jgi:hypothetical protein
MEVFTRTITQAGGKLGLAFECLPSGAFVSDVTSQAIGVSPEEPPLLPGLVLVAVQNTSVEGLTGQQALGVLARRSHERPLKLTFLRHPGRSRGPTAIVRPCGPQRPPNEPLDAAATRREKAAVAPVGRRPSASRGVVALVRAQEPPSGDRVQADDLVATQPKEEASGADAGATASATDQVVTAGSPHYPSKSLAGFTGGHMSVQNRTGEQQGKQEQEQEQEEEEEAEATEEEESSTDNDDHGHDTVAGNPAVAGYAVAQQSGAAAVRCGELDTALQHFRHCLALVPDDAIARYNLTCVEALRGQIDAALGWFEASISAGLGRRVATLAPERDPCARIYPPPALAGLMYYVSACVTWLGACCCLCAPIPGTSPHCYPTLPSASSSHGSSCNSWLL